MIGFATLLDVELINPAAYGGRGLWRLRSPLIFNSRHIGIVFVEAGFETDFASVPRVPLVFDLMGDMAHSAGTVHDWLYYRAEVPRKLADMVLREAALASGVSPWRASLMYRAVRLFGSSHYGTRDSKLRRKS